MKNCTKCGLDLPDAAFYSERTKVGGVRLRAQCKACMKKRQDAAYAARGKAWMAQAKRLRESTPERYAEYQRRTKHYKLKSVYGITIEDHDRMWAEQDGRCFVCQRSEDELGRSLAVDHDHSTGQVRGLLCFDCNTSLGKLEAHLDRLRLYLNRQSG